MYVNIYDLELKRIGSLQTWISLTWKEQYNDVGSLTLEVVQTDDSVALIKPWRYCSIDKSDQMMLILSVQIEDGHIVAYGKSAAEILNRRIAPSGINNQNAESALLDLVDNMESWDNLQSGERIGLSDVYTSQISGKSVLELFKTVCETTDMGFKALKVGYNSPLYDEEGDPYVTESGDTLNAATDEKTISIVCYKPKQNPNARYALEYGNLSEVSYTASDMQYYNVALVAGAGEGDERVKVYAGDTLATGTDRLEMIVDARDVQQGDDESLDDYKARLVARGEEKLLEQTHIDTVTFDISSTAASLGDIVSVRLPQFGITRKVRVTSRTITSEYNDEQIKLGVGDPIK